MGLYHMEWKEQFKLGWLTAIVEGEGHIRGRLIHVTSTDEPLMQRLVGLAEGRYVLMKPHKSNKKPVFRWYLSGDKAVLLMLQMYPFLCPRKQLQVRDALLAAPTTMQTIDHLLKPCRG